MVLVASCYTDTKLFGNRQRKIKRHFKVLRLHNVQVIMQIVYIKDSRPDV